jgi:hypothetical protein
LAVSVRGHDQRVVERDLDVEIALVDERTDDARQNEIMPSLEQPRKLPPVCRGRVEDAA